MTRGPKDWSPRGDDWIMGGLDVHLVEVHSVTPGGKRYSLQFEAVFPRGSRLTGTSVGNRRVLADGREERPVRISGLTRKGRGYQADFTAVFPPKSELTGVRMISGAEE